MGGEIITLQAGQCGNHVGKFLWSQLAKEHAIGTDGLSQLPDSSTERDDDTKPFFRENSRNKFTPRAIMMDSEPSVIADVENTFRGFFDPRNTWVASDGASAGNSWANGYDIGTRNQDDILNKIDKEIDSTDNFEGFQLLHSVAGGTGSGLGSNLLEALCDRYPKKILTTYSVFPARSSEVVVQSYNTILALRRLIEDSDATVVFDNASLLNISGKVFRNPNIDLQHTNQLISTIISSVTNSIRFPSYMYSSMSSIYSTLIPSPELHFLSPSFTPFTSDYIHDDIAHKGHSSYDVMLDLLDPSNSLVSTAMNNPTYFNVYNTIIGNVEPRQISRAMTKLQQRIKFPSWSSSAMHVNIGRRSPYLPLQPNENEVSGMMLSNMSTVVNVFENVCNTFDKVFAKGAFLNNYNVGDLFQSMQNVQDEFAESREVVQSLMEDYVAAEQDSYLDDVLVDDENMVGELEEDLDADGDHKLV